MAHCTLNHPFSHSPRQGERCRPYRSRWTARESEPHYAPLSSLADKSTEKEHQQAPVNWIINIAVQLEKSIDEIPAPSALISVILFRESVHGAGGSCKWYQPKLLRNLFSPRTLPRSYVGGPEMIFQEFDRDDVHSEALVSSKAVSWMEIDSQIGKSWNSAWCSCITSRHKPSHAKHPRQTKKFNPTSFRVLDNEMLINCHQTIKGRRKNDAAGDEAEMREVERIKKVFPVRLGVFFDSSAFVGPHVSASKATRCSDYKFNQKRWETKVKMLCHAWNLFISRWDHLTHAIWRQNEDNRVWSEVSASTQKWIRGNW